MVVAIFSCRRRHVRPFLLCLRSLLRRKRPRAPGWVLDRRPIRFAPLDGLTLGRLERKVDMVPVRDELVSVVAVRVALQQSGQARRRQLSKHGFETELQSSATDPLLAEDDARMELVVASETVFALLA